MLLIDCEQNDNDYPLAISGMFSSSFSHFLVLVSLNLPHISFVKHCNKIVIKSCPPLRYTEGHCMKLIRLSTFF
jgi:hypothetical protein